MLVSSSQQSVSFMTWLSKRTGLGRQRGQEGMCPHASGRLVRGPLSSLEVHLAPRSEPRGSGTTTLSMGVSMLRTLTRDACSPVSSSPREFNKVTLRIGKLCTF